MIKIGVDAGHGANTAGKRSPSGYREHWANAKVAYYFTEAMSKYAEIVKVAWDDANGQDDHIDIPLGERQKIIKNAGCDYSVSFHFNACGDGVTYNSGQGVVTYASNVAARVGDSINLAHAVQKHMIEGTPQKDRGVKTSNFAMVNCQAMGTKASILVECAFMTNEYEEKLMKSDDFCKECGEEAAKGFLDYLGIKEEVKENVDKVDIILYSVKKGDSLSKIAKEYGVKWKDIAELNGIKFPYIIKVGDTIGIKIHG